jgi:hypothetical protein
MNVGTVLDIRAWFNVCETGVHISQHEIINISAYSFKSVLAVFYQPFCSLSSGKGEILEDCSRRRVLYIKTFRVC